MGNIISYWQAASTLPKEEVEEISKETGISQKQITRLYSRFQLLDTQGHGYLERDDLLKIPELSKNPLCERIVDGFFMDDQKISEQISFRQFVNVIAHFRPINKDKSNNVNSREAKLRFAFSMYDQNLNNSITRDEFKEILSMMVRSKVTAEQLDHIAERTMDEADIDKDGIISFEEFCKAMEKIDIEQKMSLRFLS